MLYIQGFMSLLGFLTIIPLPQKYLAQSPAKGFWGVILVGLILSALIITPQWLLSPWLERPFIAILAVLLGILLTGGLHDDGFADICDAAFGAHEPQARRTILKDSRIGVFGVLGLVILLLSEYYIWLGLNDHNAITYMIAFITLPRIMLIMAFYMLPMQPSGLANAVGTITRGQYIAALLLFLLVGTILLSWWILVIIALYAIILVLWALFIQRKFGAGNGDAIGFLYKMTAITTGVFLLHLL